MTHDGVTRVPQADLFRTRDPNEAAFWKFHQENPHIYHQLVRLARQAVKAGHTTYGMAALFEVLRWQRTVETTTQETGPKMANALRAYYARLIMRNEIDLAGFFAVAQSAADNAEDERLRLGGLHARYARDMTKGTR